MSEQQAEQVTEKPADECAFLDCRRPRVPKDPTVRGARPRYCDDPEHNAAAAWKAKHRGPTAIRSAQAVEEDLDARCPAPPRPACTWASRCSTR